MVSCTSSTLDLGIWLKLLLLLLFFSGLPLSAGHLPCPFPCIAEGLRVSSPKVTFGTGSGLESDN